MEEYEITVAMQPVMLPSLPHFPDDQDRKVTIKKVFVIHSSIYPRVHIQVILNC